jgi:hypothetical protein
LNHDVQDHFDESHQVPILAESPRKKLAVRKFPSYGWSREREARVKLDMTKPVEVVQAPTNRKSSGRVLDFPTFQLSGLAETAPKEVEGWFTSKVSLLRRLSEASGSKSSTSPGSSRSGSVIQGNFSLRSNFRRSGSEFKILRLHL